MTFSHFNRRLHLYLGMFLLSWFFLYGVSSIPFSHQSWGQKVYNDGTPDWKTRFERPYHIEVPKEGDLKPTGAQILKDAGLSGAFWVNREKSGIVRVQEVRFLGGTRLTYFPDKDRLVGESKRFRWDHFLTGMHARGGFSQPSLMNQAWGYLVDVVCLGILVWIASGIYMWWPIRGHRVWGWLALTGGVLSFAVFLAAL